MNPVFEKARAFLYRNARPLELALFRYFFENGPQEDVMRALAAYQNGDGGFGHALEADNWNPNSNPLHGSVAVGILNQIDWADGNHPMIRRLVDWFASGAYFNGAGWELVIPSNSDYPHAPWWHPESESSCHTTYNGTAQIAGFLIRFAPRGSRGFDLGLRVASEAVAALDPDTLDSMHTCDSYVLMAQIIEKAGATGLIAFDQLMAGLHRCVHRLIETDPSKWNAYVCKPSQFIRSRESVFYAENAGIAQYECDFIENTQLADGSWAITWDWQAYPEEWAVAKNWWKGQLTLQNLLYLKGMGRL